MFYTMKIAGVERNLPLCPLNDELMIAGFVIFGDPEITTACAKELLEKAPEYDYIITAEAKGIPLAHEMARLQGNQKYFVARKKPKLYMTGVFESTVNSITTEGEQKLYLDMADAELMKGKRILFNTSIGPGFDTNALKEWLKDDNHYFFGDTLATIGDLNLWDLPNTFTINRSSGGKTYQAFKRLGEKVLNNIDGYYINSKNEFSLIIREGL